MSNIFSQLPVYAESWQVKDSRSFTSEEIEAVKSAEVVESQYGFSVCFTMLSGGRTYIPVDVNSSVSEGDVIDLKKARLLTLGKNGQADIYRVSC